MFVLVCVPFENPKSLIEANIGFIDIVEDCELFALEEKHDDTLRKSGIIGVKCLVLQHQVIG
jgi:hypothetical protein